MLKLRKKYALYLFIFFLSGTLYGLIESKVTSAYINEEYPETGRIETSWQVNYDENKVKEVFNFLCDPKNISPDNKRFTEINLAFEKLRKSIQSHVGLSKLQRDKEESYKEVLIKNDVSDDWEQNIIYALPNDAGDSSNLKSTYIKVIESRDHASKPGISFMYKTKFRTFVLKISSSGNVTSSLDLNWKEINKDIETQFTSLRSFSSWEWHSQSNFFNTRSTNTALGILSDIFNFSYDKHKYFSDELDSINVNRNNIKKIVSDKSNIYLIIGKDVIEPDGSYHDNLENSAFALVEIYKPILGTIPAIFPVIYDGEKNHIVIYGHREATEVKEIFTVDYQNTKLVPWKWKGKIKSITIKNQKAINSNYKIKDFRLLENDDNKRLIKHITTSPMIRGSDLPTRIYWLSTFARFGIYSEMTTIADLLNVKRTGIPLSNLKASLYSEQAIQSIERIMISEYELINAREIIFQVAIPHPLGQEDYNFFWGKNGEHIARTTTITKEIISKLTQGYNSKIKLGINMCCPAPAMENSNSGFGLRNNRSFINTILDSSSLPTEIKMLMLSEDEINQNEISIKKNQDFTGYIINRENMPRIIYQAKSRNNENYSFDSILEIAGPYANNNLKFTYSGMVAALTMKSLKNIGFNEGEPHYSAEYILNNAFDAGHNNAQIMLGRILLGSSFLLQGKYISDKEILAHTLLHLPLLTDMFDGMGLYGVERIKIQVLYHVRHLTKDKQKVNALMTDIFNAKDTESVKNLLLAYYKELPAHKNEETASLEAEFIKYFPELSTKL